MQCKVLITVRKKSCQRVLILYHILFLQFWSSWKQEKRIKEKCYFCNKERIYAHLGFFKVLIIKSWRSVPVESVYWKEPSAKMQRPPHPPPPPKKNIRIISKENKRIIHSQCFCRKSKEDGYYKSLQSQQLCQDGNMQMSSTIQAKNILRLYL